jgi:hypothetical protein
MPDRDSGRLAGCTPAAVGGLGTRPFPLDWTDYCEHPAEMARPTKTASELEQMILARVRDEMVCPTDLLPPISSKRAAKEDGKKVEKATPARARKRA